MFRISKTVARKYARVSNVTMWKKSLLDTRMGLRFYSNENTVDEKMEESSSVNGEEPTIPSEFDFDEAVVILNQLTEDILESAKKLNFDELAVMIDTYLHGTTDFEERYFMENHPEKWVIVIVYASILARMERNSEKSLLLAEQSTYLLDLCEARGNPQPTFVYFVKNTKGMIYFEQKEYEKALKELEPLTGTDSSDDFDQINMYCAYAHAHLSNYDKALYYFERMREKHQNDAQILVEIGNFHKDFPKNYELANRYYMEAIELSPKDPQLRYNYANFRKENLNDIDGCLEQLEIAMRAESKYFPPFYLAGRIYADRGEYQRAHDLLETIVPQTEDIDSLMIFARLQRKIRAYDKAEGTLEKIVSLIKKSPEFLSENLYIEYIQLMIAMQRWRSAQSLIEEGLSHFASSEKIASLEDVMKTTRTEVEKRKKLEEEEQERVEEARRTEAKKQFELETQRIEEEALEKERKRLEQQKPF